MLRGKKGQEVWIGRWREDNLRPSVIGVGESTTTSIPTVSDQISRVHRSVVLGTLQELPTKRLAQRALDAKLREINSLDYRPKATVVFKDFAQQWMDIVMPQHKPSSQNTERGLITHHILPFFKDVRLDDITSSLIQEFVSTRGVGPRSTKDIFGMFKRLWSTAKAWGLVKEDPAKGVRCAKIQSVERPSFNPEQMHRIIKAAVEPWKTFYWLASETGMRTGELCALRWEDVSAGQVFVRQSVWRGRVGTPKSRASTRRIDISEGLSAHLSSLQRSVDVPFVFSISGGRPIPSSTVWKALQTVCRRLGIPPAGMHAFRHGNASFLVAEGEDLVTIAQRLGHHDPSVTLRIYSHARPMKGKPMAEKLSFVLNVPTSNVQVVDSELVCA